MLAVMFHKEQRPEMTSYATNKQKVIDVGSKSRFLLILNFHQARL